MFFFTNRMCWPVSVPSWNVLLEPSTDPIVLRGPRVSAALLHQINITLTEADRTAEPGKKPAESRGIFESVRIMMHLRSSRGHTERWIQKCLLVPQHLMSFLLAENALCASLWFSVSSQKYFWSRVKSTD